MKLKEINGKHYQECDVVILATNNKTNLFTANFGKELTKATYNSYYHTGQHLYVVSDEEIKEGDWVLSQNGWIRKCILIEQNYVNGKDGFWELLPRCKKIIATTDSSLKIKDVTRKLGEDKPNLISLPQPSTQFIEKFIKSYNEGNVITKMLVEYDLNGCCGNILTSCFERNHCNETVKLKVDKSNQITIIKQKDSWNRGEHIINLLSYRNDLLIELSRCKNLGIPLQKEFTDNWIEQNL